MRPLSQNDIEAELSYAFIHAVASRAGMSCSVANRPQDNAGVDATITAWGPFHCGSFREEVDLKVQLKATTIVPTDTGDSLSYFLREVSRYDDLRAQTAVPRILAVLFLPSDDTEWLTMDHDALIMRRCAYWVSLLGAPATTNQSGTTVYLPKVHLFDPDTLGRLMDRIADSNFPGHGQTI